MRIAIVGAGPVGMLLAAALHHRAVKDFELRWVVRNKALRKSVSHKGLLLFPQSTKPVKAAKSFVPDPSRIPPETEELTPPDRLAQLVACFERKPRRTLRFEDAQLMTSTDELDEFSPEVVLVAVKAHSVLRLRRKLAKSNAITIFVANGFWMHPGMDLGVLLAGGFSDGNRLSYGRGGKILLGRLKSPHAEFLLAQPENGPPGALIYNLRELELMEELTKALDPDFIQGELVADIYPHMLQKAIVNCLVNPLSAASGEVNGALLEPWAGGIVAAMLEEILSVLKTASFLPEDDERFTNNALLSAFEEVCRATFHNRSSMQVDVLRGRPTELPHLNMLVAHLGERYGIPCPLNRTVSEMVLMTSAFHQPV
ncbi:MAG: hypothetical protein B1H03_04240 [Planctomycetales bacterium 4484_113]|nr:MAG: hypothetical protein B1H03_04240 [Planctomycetales bacterium 4484_113]